MLHKMVISKDNQLAWLCYTPKLSDLIAFIKILNTKNQTYQNNLANQMSWFYFETKTNEILLFWKLDKKAPNSGYFKWKFI